MNPESPAKIDSYPYIRREPRTPNAGQLLVELAPDGEMVCGSLLNVSPHGFCITHQHKGFTVGQEVRVVYTWGRVPARVIWVSARGNEIATGFRTDRP